jgi:nitroreductase
VQEIYTADKMRYTICGIGYCDLRGGDVDMEVMVAVRERRSVRKYKSEPVAEQDINTVLEAARWAPSWANSQCPRFVVVRDAMTKAKLAETMVPPTPAVPSVREAPVVIVACAELEKSGYKKGSVITDKGDWFMFDVALAMQNVTLAAHSLGLGTVHVGTFDAKKVGEIIGVPPGIAVVEMMPLGHPDEQPEAPPRKQLSEIVYYEKYGSKK